MCAVRKSACGAARCKAATNASGSSTVANPGTAGSRRIRSFSMVESMLGLLDARVHFFGPTRLLAFEDAAGYLDQRAGAMQRKTFAPGFGRDGKVFFDKCRGRCARSLARQIVHADTRS